MKPINFLPALVFVATSHAATRTAADFAKDGKLDETACRLFIIDRQKTSADKLFKPGSMTIDSVKLKEQTNDLYRQIVIINKPNGPPFTIQQVNAAVDVGKQPEQEKKAWEKIPGVTAPYTPVLTNKDSSLTLGPIAIRKDFEEIKKDPSDAKGAKISFADNHQSGENGAWNTQGVIYWPAIGDIPFPSNGSILFDAGIAAEWNVAERESPKTKLTDPGDVEDLTLSIPFTLDINLPAPEGPVFSGGSDLIEGTSGGSTGHWVVQAKPYLNTDFSFDHEIYGTTASIRYVGRVFGSPVFIGKYKKFSYNSGWMDKSDLRYQLTLTPTLDYSYVEQGGTHTSRKPGDDWLRVGTLGGIDIAFGPTDTPFTFGTSYQFFDTIDGKGGYSYLWKSNATWWIAPQIGLSLEHQVGVTPISDKDVDQTTFGVEFRY